MSKCDLRGYGQLKVLKRIEIKVNSSLQELDSVLLQFNQIYQEFIPNRDWLTCKLAVAEGFTNAVRHAHKELPTEMPIKIEAILKPTALEIYIWDFGNPFNLKKYIENSSQTNDNWLGSGRGVAILAQIADRLEYRRVDDKRNCLIIVKQFSQSNNNER